MAPWFTRRITVLFLVLFVLSMVAPPVLPGLAEDAATPEVVVEPSAVDVPPEDPAPAPPTFAPDEVTVPADPVPDPPVPDEDILPPAAPTSRQTSESSTTESDEPLPEVAPLTILVIDLLTSEPIAGAYVYVEFVGSGTTGVDGRFAAGDVALGTYYVEISADGYAGWNSYVDVYGAVEYPIGLEQIWVPQPGSLTVTVIDAVSKLPIPGAVVTFIWPSVTGVTDTTGVWVSDELPGGISYFDVTAEGYMPGTAETTIDGGTSITVPLQPILPGTLTVEVVSLETGMLIAGATVVVSTYYGNEYVTEGMTGDDGRFNIILPGGEYAVEVRAPSFLTSYAYPFVSGDDFVRIELAPAPLPGVMTVTVLVEGSGDPVAGALVTVYDPGWSVVASGLTDEHGRLITPELSPAYYFVDVSKQGYENGINSVQLNGNAEVTVTMLPIPPSSITVHVTDLSTWMELPGATVIARDVASGVDVASATTGEAGIATMEVLGGYYRVVVSADGYFPNEVETYVSGATDVYVGLEPRIAGEILVHVIDATGWQSLPGATVVITEADSGAEITRGVTGENGTFQSGMLDGGNYLATVEMEGYVASSAWFRVNGPDTVTLVVEREPGVLTVHAVDSLTGEPVGGTSIVLHDYYGQPYGGGTTDADGFFVTDQLPGGSYHVWANADGYVPTSIMIDIMGDATAEVSMEPTAPGVLAVTVLDDETGAPIRRAEVRVLDAVNIEVAGGETGKDGQFLTPTLPSGQYQVRVAAAGYDDGYAFPYVNGPTERTITLRAQLPGTLTIRVVDELTGEPVGKGSVVVYDGFGTIYADGKLKKTGEFQTGVLPEGEYSIDITASGYIPARSWAWVQGDTVQEITIAPRLSGTLTVTVVDQTIETPIPGARVLVYDESRADVAWGTTDAAGIYVSEQLESGDYHVMITAEGYIPSGDIYLRVNGDTGTQAWLQPSTPGTLAVDVLGWDTYMWIPGATVVVRDATSMEEVARGATDEWGSYTTPELPGGDYLVRVTAVGYASSTSYVRISGPMTVPLYLEPQEPLEPGLITLTLQAFPSGAPVAGAGIVVLDPDDYSVVTAGTTDALGGFTTGELAGGEYVIRVDADFYHPSESMVVVDGVVEITYGIGMQTTATVRLYPVYVEPGGQVMVTGAGFIPSETVRITWAVPGGEVLAEVKVTKDGTFSKKVRIPEASAGMSSIVAEGLESGKLGAWYVIVTVPDEPSLTP